jgi:hypothetical protein
MDLITKRNFETFNKYKIRPCAWPVYVTGAFDAILYLSEVYILTNDFDFIAINKHMLEGKHHYVNKYVDEFCEKQDQASTICNENSVRHLYENIYNVMMGKYWKLPELARKQIESALRA